MLLSTCDRCLSGFHRRCENRRECLCSVCLGPSRKARLVEAEIEVPPLEDPAKVAHREYVREWRRRQRDGEAEPRILVTDEVVVEMVRLREEGLTVRQIAERVGFDYSGVARHLRSQDHISESRYVSQ